MGPDQTTLRRGRLRGFLVPSLADCVFVSILGWLFFAGAGAASLLADGDTGWHIRTGEHILATGAFPHEDLFSFTMEGRQWFAWEWLSDTLFALVHQVAGLKGIVFLGGVVIAGTAALLFRYMMWLEVNVLVAILGMFAALSPATMHWLSRPHMFTWGFLLFTLWLLEADRRRPSRRVYWLVPLVIVWTNTHGGFVAALVVIGIYLAGGSIEEWWGRGESGEALRAMPRSARRYGGLLLLCLAGTLVNPYGYHLHEDIGAYLQSDFILKYVQEFQSPDFRGESMKVYELVLIVSILLAGRMLVRRQVTLALLVLAWAHASLISVRHMPLFMIVAVPFLAREVSELLEAGAKTGNTWLRAVSDIARDYGRRIEGSPGQVRSESGPFVFSLLGIAAMAGLAVMLQLRAGERDWKAEFPVTRFPAMACDILGDRLRERRTLSTDQWGDYLIYRYYPEVKVFIDGRSDFYDPALRDEYVELLGAHWKWETILGKYDLDGALIPASWSLAAAMKLSVNWRLIYDDGTALFFERIP